MNFAFFGGDMQMNFLVMQWGMVKVFKEGNLCCVDVMKDFI